jgi:hypothetical protein
LNFVIADAVEAKPAIGPNTPLDEVPGASTLL